MRRKLITLVVILAFSSGLYLCKDNVVVISEDVRQQTTEVKESPKSSDVSVADKGIVELKDEQEPALVTFVHVDRQAWVTGSCSFYENCDGTGNVLGILDNKAEVFQVTTGDNGYSEIMYNDMSGFIESKYLTDTKPIVIVCENDGVSEDWVSIINDELSVVPDHILETFIESGWHMYCTSMNIDNAYYGGQYGAVMATTNYNEARILIEDRTDAVTESPVHELGHWLDYHLGYTTNSAEYMNIYYNESSSFRTYYGVNFYFDNKELFAEGFWKYWVDPEGLQECAPGLYSYIDGVVPYV